MNRLRSLLFVPADSERKLARAGEAGADAVILDCEDSVAAAAKPDARRLAAAFLREQAAIGAERWVRINPLDTADALADLAAVVAAAPDGVMLPKAAGPGDVARLSHYLDALEAQAGLPAGRIGIIPVATETPAAPFALGDYATAALPRLRGLTWGAEDLSAALGASTHQRPAGGWADAYALVRSLVLLAAHAAGVEAIDTLLADYRDTDAVLAASQASRAEGFTGRLAIHPAQVAPINDGYRPTEAELDHARRVIAAFAAQPGAGAVGLDGRMLDRPHLRQAERLLEQAGG